MTKTSIPLTIQRLGRLDKLEGKDPEILEKLRAQVAEMNQNANKRKNPKNGWKSRNFCQQQPEQKQKKAIRRRITGMQSIEKSGMN